MSTHPSTPRQRIDEVEARIAQRQQRLPLHWHKTQRAARALLRIDRTLPIVAIGAVVVVGYFLLRRPPPAKAGAATAGGLLGMLVGAGLTLLQPRYGAVYSLGWQLLSRLLKQRRAGAGPRGGTS